MSLAEHPNSSAFSLESMLAAQICWRMVSERRCESPEIATYTTLREVIDVLGRCGCDQGNDGEGSGLHFVDLFSGSFETRSLDV